MENTKINSRKCETCANRGSGWCKGCEHNSPGLDQFDFYQEMKETLDMGPLDSGGGTIELLEKFDAVEICPDVRITEADQQFCQQHQAAYTAALHSFQELTYFWEDMLAAQKAILGKPDSSPGAYNQYLLSGDDDGPKITIHRLRVQIDTLHRKFIHALAGYFESAYSITIKENELEAELIPPRPKKRDSKSKQALKEHLLWSSTVHLRYEDIVAQIQSGFDGRNFSEQSLQELCRRCNEAAWSGFRHKAKFERKYAVISFLESFCRFLNDPQRWEFTKDIKPVLLCAAHFETGSLGTCPAGFPSPPFEETLADNLLDFPGYEKLVQIRLFKNGRVDLRFSNEDNANQFIDSYLGRVYQGQVSK